MCAYNVTAKFPSSATTERQKEDHKKKRQKDQV